MAKRPRAGKTNSKKVSREDAKEIASGVTSKKAEKKQEVKEDTKGRNHKVLYVSPDHHQTAKKNSFLKGFSKLRDYIESLIDADNKS